MNERWFGDWERSKSRKDGKGLFITELEYLGICNCENVKIILLKMRRIGYCLYYISPKPHSFSKGTRRPVHPSKSSEEGKEGKADKSMKILIREECKDDFWGVLRVIEGVC